MAPFYGWGSTTSRLEPLRGGSLLVANVLFWVLWAYLATHIPSDTINLQKTFRFYL